jgi:hypothetical protein
MLPGAGGGLSGFVIALCFLLCLVGMLLSFIYASGFSFSWFWCPAIIFCGIGFVGWIEGREES